MRRVQPLVAEPMTNVTKTTRSWFLASALYDGVEDEDLRQIKTLLEDKGADPNMLLPEYGIAPIHLIVGNPCKAFALKATRLCLLAGANPNIRSEEGLTPVHVTAIWGRVEVLELLLRNGGDPWLVDYEQKINAFQYAQQENQWGAYNLMATFCGLDKNRDHQAEVLSPPSPCTLELKRVLVYKNDLCVEYEPGSTEKPKSDSKKNSVETMTSPRTLNTKSVSVQTVTTPPQPKCKSCIVDTQYQECTCLEDSGDFDWCKEQSDSQPSSQTLQMIKNHRKTMVIYESVPPRTSSPDEEFTSHVSWRNNSSYDNTDFKVNLVSELKKKLDQTNKVRLLCDTTGVESNRELKNVTYRLSNSLNVNIPTEVTDSYEADGVFSDTNNVPIGFVIDDHRNSVKHTTSDVGSQCNPPDIGFKVQTSADELNDAFLQENSLISDISSDIDTMPQTIQVLVENVLTEDDECTPEEIINSSSSNTYATCNEDDSYRKTGNNISNTCKELVRCKITHSDNDDNVVHDTAGKKDFDSLISEENSVTDDQQKPSRPSNILNENEDDSVCSTNAISGSPCGDLGQEYNSQLNSKKWIEAHISYTSDEEEEQEMSISEEYQYTDTDEGIVLIEKRYIFDDVSIAVTAGSVEATSENNKQTSSESDMSTLSKSTSSYDTDLIRKDLQEIGLTSGPITKNTKRVYLRRLKRYRRKPPTLPEVNIPVYTCELSRTLTAVNLQQLLTEWGHLEREMCSVFETADPDAKWREGFAKTSFTYLLLDPRITHNLPNRALSMPSNEVWSDFLQSVFYIGKGKRSRPYSHLYQAVAVWNNSKQDKSAKVERILEIWRAGLGVVCLHVFQNIIPVEAYTREAAMISALSLERLTNEKAGEFYGPAATWQLRQKRHLGIVLLHKTSQMFLAEGERQLRPGDID